MTRIRRMTPVMWLGIVAVVLLVLLGLLVWDLRGGGVRSQARALVSVGRAVLDDRPASTGGDFTDVIFVHHSTGRNLIHQGRVRERLTSAGFQFWDHDYNDVGLTRPSGERAGYSYNVPGDNTNPDGFARVFSQRVHQEPLNAFSGLMQHDVIIFKSCFPVSDITSDAHLEEWKEYYIEMREVMDRHRDHIFIVVTQPPLNPAATDADTAARARALASWLESDEFLAGHPNVFTFDFFDLLAEGDASAPDFNMLRAAYRDGEDSHPNKLANEKIGPLFVDFVIEAVEMYRAEGWWFPLLPG